MKKGGRTGRYMLPVCIKIMLWKRSESEYISEFCAVNTEKDNVARRVVVVLIEK